MVPSQIFAPKIVEILNYPQGEIALKWILEKAKRSEANSRRFSRESERKRAAKNETRREKRAKSVFRATTKAIEESKIAAKNFSQNCENHPIFGVRNSAC